jgi:hypothetical protein
MIPLRALHITNVVLAACLAYAVYGAVGGHRHPVGTLKSPAAKDAEEPLPGEWAVLPRSHYGIIEQADIFRNRDVVPTPPPAPTAVPPPTPPPPPLNIELKGTTTAPRGGKMKALLFNKKTRKFDYYGLNDIIPETNGARIVEIGRDKVIFDRGGVTEKLDLYPVDLRTTKEATAGKKL